VLDYTHDLGGAGSDRGSAEFALGSGVGEDAASTTLSVGVGLLAGLNDDTADYTLKLSIEVGF
jgi:hypothetical protein